MESRSTMAENIALEVKFQGETQIYSPSYRTSWEDLHAMLKCSFEVDDIAVFYLDDENEEVAIDTQEEYNEAKKVSDKFENVLQMRVYPVTRQIGVTIPAAEAPPLPKMTVEAWKRSQGESAPAADSPSNASSSPSPATEPIPIPPPRPAVPPRLNRAQSLPGHAHKQASVTGCVRQAVEELKQMNEGDIEESPEMEKVLIDRIVRGVLDGLDTSDQDRTRTRPSSWSTSQDARLPSTCSSSQPDQTGTKTNSRSPGRGPILEHTGISCDNCNSRIYGIRYKCGHCLDYDLCEECEALSGIHDPNHVYLKLKRPAYRVGMKSDGRVAPILKHPVYADDDSPVWEYKIKKLEEKIARKAARAELKRKYREEKRRVKLDCHGQVSPTKRERIERMAERQAEQIMVAASQHVTPPFTQATAGILAENTPLLVRKFDARFLRDGNLPDETHMQPRTKFVKSWIMKNIGNVQWNRDTKLKFLWGDIKLLSDDLMDIPPLTPGEEGPICVDFEAPARAGKYQSHWRLTQKGDQFGHRVWCIIIVDKAEVLEPTCEKRKTVREEIVLAEVQENTESSENTPSNAVAHLQTGQLEEADLSRVVSSSDVLTAQDVFSFELLNIRDDQDREADKEVEGVNSPAATTTPNNTPIVGLTPCISPVPQLDEKLLCRRVSEHSDLEFVRREDIPEIVETPDSVIRNDPVSENVKEGVEMGAVYSDFEDGVESIGSSSDDSDILDDFYVVPLPDCFDPSKPIDKSMIMSKSSLSSSMTSSTISTSPVVRLPSYEESEAERDMPSITMETSSVTTDEEADVATTSNENLIPEEEKEGSNTETEESNEILVDAEDSGVVIEPAAEGDIAARESRDHTVDSLLGMLSNPALETTPLIPLIAASPVQQLNSSPRPTQHTVTMTPMPAITLFATPAEAPSTSDGGVLINPEGSVVYQTPGQQQIVRQPESNVREGTSVDLIENAMQQLDIADPGQGQERSEEHDDEFHDAQDAPENAPQTAPEDAPQTAPEDAPPTEPQNTYSGVHYQAQAAPVDLLGYTAARAVEVAGSVVRQAFDTAASSVGALLRPQGNPMPAPYQPPPPPSDSRAAPPSTVGPTPMEQLIEMGFANRTRNQDLLTRHNDDVSRCVQELLQNEDNNWPNNRH